MTPPPDRGSADAYSRRQARYWSRRKHRARRDPRHPVVRAYAQGKIREILRRVPLPERPRILDLGGGNGYFSHYWQEVGPTIAADYSLVMLSGNPVRLRAAVDARHLAWRTSSFDLAFCHALLHHVAREHRVRVLREMARVSKRFVVFVEPHRRNPLMAGLGLLQREERGVLDFSLRYCRELAEEAGLRVIRACPWGVLTPNRMPLPGSLAALLGGLERPLALGVSNLVIAERGEGA